MADKTFPGETIKSIRNEDIRSIQIRCSEGRDGQPPAGEPMVVGVTFIVRDANGDEKRTTSVGKDVTKLSAAKRAILTGLRDDGKTFAQKKLDDATKPNEV